MPDEPQALYLPLGEHLFESTPWTRGPWDPRFQHGGPPAALLARAFEAAASDVDLPQIVRMTFSLLRPVPIAPLTVTARVEHTGQRSATLSGTLTADGAEVVRATGLALRAADVVLPKEGPHLENPPPPTPPQDCPAFELPFVTGDVGYHRVMETRLAAGTFSAGPTTMWFRLRCPLLPGETPSPVQRVMATADSGNGISIVLDFFRYTFINPDLTVHVLRAPVGEWIALEARTDVGPQGAGMAATRIFDTTSLVGAGVQSLLIEKRADP